MKRKDMTGMQTVKVLEITNTKTGKTVQSDFVPFSQWVQKNPAVLNEHTVRYVEKTILTYCFKVWIHSKRGGTDKAEIWTVSADTEQKAREWVQKRLKRISATTDDVTMFKEGEEVPQGLLW